MNIERLRVFLAVYECSSMTAAAARLGITQPAVSQSIRELEAEVHASLFLRARKGLLPTAHADRFWEAARRAVRAFDTAELESKVLHQPSRAAMRVGATFGPGTSILPAAIHSFLGVAGDVLPSLRVMENESMASALRTGDFDVAVLNFAPARFAGRRFEAQTLFRDPMVLVESTAARNPHLVSGVILREQLKTLPMILPPLGTIAREQLIDLLEEHRIDAHALVTTMEIECPSAVIEALALGSGVAFMSHFTALAAITQGTLRMATIAGASLQTNVTAVRDRQGMHSEALDAFWSHLQRLSYLSVAQLEILEERDAAPPSSQGARSSSKAS